MRLLALVHPGTNSRSIFTDMLQGMVRAGHRVDILELGPLWNACRAGPEQAREAVLHETRRVHAFLTGQGVDAVVGMWGNAATSLMLDHAGDGGPITIFDHIGVPHLFWWLDAPHWAANAKTLWNSPLPRRPGCVHMINNAGTAREMREILGFGRTLDVPYGINERVFRPFPATGEFDVVVSCGPGDPPPSPAALEQLESNEPDVDAIRDARAREIHDQIPGLVSSQSAGDGVVALLRALLATQRRQRHAPMLARLQRLAAQDASLSAALAELRSRPELYVRGTELVRSVETFERAFLISWLSRRLRVAVFGSATLGPWGCHATMLGDLPYEGMPAAYARGRVALSAMRWQDDVGVNIKPMEMTASGVASVCVHREGLADLFAVGREILTYDTPARALAAVRELLDNPRRRAELAGAGLERTLKDHTWTRRAGAITGVLAEVRRTLRPMGATPAAAA